jgi:hypothetical protein
MSGAGTPFSLILADLDASCPGFETAVFFDNQGEAIDFHSTLDAFGARLIGAYHVVLFLSADARFTWLGAGRVTYLELSAERRDSVTTRVAEGYYLTVIVQSGRVDDALLEKMSDVAARLREEAGL